MRDIIQRGSMIELAFEGKHYWDLRSWKLAVNYFNQNITGWSVHQEAETDYYQLRTLFSQTFVAPRDYFWPIAEYELTFNPALWQTLGWYILLKIEVDEHVTEYILDQLYNLV